MLSSTTPALPVTLRHCCWAISCPRVQRLHSFQNIKESRFLGDRVPLCSQARKRSTSVGDDNVKGDSDAGKDSNSWGKEVEGRTWKKKWPQAQNCKVYKAVWCLSLRAWSCLALVPPLGETVHVSKCWKWVGILEVPSDLYFVIILSGINHELHFCNSVWIGGYIKDICILPTLIQQTLKIDKALFFCLLIFWKLSKCDRADQVYEWMDTTLLGCKIFWCLVSVFIINCSTAE